MILGTKKVINGKQVTAYVIKDIYKGSDGSIDSYQVTISRNIGGPPYDVVLDAREMEAVASNPSVAYDYIYQISHGMELYKFLISGYDERYVDNYREICHKHIPDEHIEFRFDYAHHISLIDYCNSYWVFALGVSIVPRYTLDECWYPGYYKDNFKGVHLDWKSDLNDLENFEITIHGMMWVRNNVRNIRGTMSDHKFIKYVINENNDEYHKALDKNIDIFEERIKDIRDNQISNGKER